MSHREIGKHLGRDNKTIAAAIKRHLERLAGKRQDAPTPCQRYFDTLRQIGYGYATRLQLQNTARTKRAYVAALETAYDNLVFAARQAVSRDNRPKG